MIRKIIMMGRIWSKLIFSHLKRKLGLRRSISRRSFFVGFSNHSLGLLVWEKGKGMLFMLIRVS